MANQTTSHQCSGEIIKAKRMSLSMTQDKLAAMSNTNVRTIQRAEKSLMVQMETIASIAAALNTQVSDIISRPISNEAGEEIEEYNAVVLRPITSGKLLLDMLCTSFSATLVCNAEPTQSNIENLSAAVERIEKLLPDPWCPPHENPSLSLAERLRESLTLTKKLSNLVNLGLSVYAGSYTTSVQVPRFDMDEGFMSISGRQKPELVTACRILIDKSGLERVVQEVQDKWESPPNRLDIEGAFDADETPF